LLIDIHVIYIDFGSLILDSARFIAPGL
jgi:hypothetical protein